MCLEIDWFIAFTSFELYLCQIRSNISQVNHIKCLKLFCYKMWMMMLHIILAKQWGDYSKIFDLIMQVGR
ncbi:hypothetical protein MtrunA17_Chr6g0477901 [Medicago truncatula]|uniref:Uncharacterized protein n=1 Tax=Medicago truncatula TaxID=3880 RepID=A0A396HFT0_MEDTR|nr:hypothetical protein MtrunA17_Chr6g0477901 [Medicago truncatula]